MLTTTQVHQAEVASLNSRMERAHEQTKHQSQVVTSATTLRKKAAKLEQALAETRSQVAARDNDLERATADVATLMAKVHTTLSSPTAVLSP